MEHYASILTAVLGLITAWFSYKAVVKKTVKESHDQIAVTFIQDPSVKHEYWNSKKLLFIVIIVQFLAFIIFSFALGFDLIFLFSMLIGALVGCGFLLLFLKFLRHEPPSRVIKTITIAIKADRSKILAKSLEAVQNLGAKISLVDEEHGKIEAKKSINFWSFGDIIDIYFEEKSEGIVSVKITSDCIMPTALFDFGHNARNVRKIKDHLLGK